jgi:hypothetical protein
MTSQGVTVANVPNVRLASKKMAKNPTLIQHSVVLTISKLKMIPDKRYKTGFREVTTLAESYITLKPETSQNFNLNHIDDRPPITMTSVSGMVEMSSLDGFERVL